MLVMAKELDTASVLRLELPASKISFCVVCGHRVSSASDLRSHLDGCVGSGNWKVTAAMDRTAAKTQRPKRWECQQCKRKFASSAHLQKHRFFCDSSVLLCDFEALGEVAGEDKAPPAKKKASTAKKGSEAKGKGSTCPICRKSFANAPYLKIHMKIHTGEKPHSCSLCPSAFTDRTALRNHLKMHSDDRPFKCSLCDKAFRRSDNLKYHLASHATGRPFLCAFCCKGFKNERDLRVHERNVHVSVSSATEGKHACQECELTFQTYNALKYHRRTKHADGGGTAQCPTCHASFAKASELATHLKSHGPAEEKLHTCAFCPASFSRLAQRRQHEQRKHAEMEKDGEGSEEKDQVFICGFCTIVFSNEDEAKEHMVVHVEEVSNELANDEDGAS